MQLRGNFHSLMRDIEGNVIVSLSVGKTLPDISKIEGKDLDIKLSQHRERRSLDANGYYWVLNSKLATKLNISTARLHNLMLRDVAPPFIIDGKIAMQPIPDTDKAEDEILEASTFHLKPTSGIIVGKDSNVYRWYIVLRGSSTFDTKEMYALLQRLIEECKANGIETATEQELVRMRVCQQ